jgi:hypothetical protein
MGIVKKCPWCDEKVHSNRYPRSAGIRGATTKLKKHIENKHPEKEETYQELVKLWRQKVGNDPTKQGIIQSYKEVYKSLIGNKPKHPKRNDFENMNPKEIHEFLRKIGY